MIVSFGGGRPARAAVSVLVSLMGALLTGTGPAAASAHPSARLFATFDRCEHDRCTVRVPDDSGHRHVATVHTDPGGGPSAEPGVDQFKLQIDAGRQGCVIKGDDARVFDFAPSGLPVDGHRHSVVCKVTPETTSYIVDGTPYRVANTTGPVEFPDAENLQIGGNYVDDGVGDPVVHPIDDAFFAMTE